RRRLDLERERLVLVDRDHGRTGRALLHLLCLGVERLAELHDVEPALTQRGSDRRRWRRRAGRDFQFQEAYDFLCHFSPFRTAPAAALALSWCDLLVGWRPTRSPTTQRRVKASRPARTRVRPVSPGRKWTRRP